MVIILYILALFSALIGIKLNSKKYNIFAVLALILGFIVMINGDNNNVDLLNYQNTYLKVKKNIDFSIGDFGYYYLQKLAIFLHLDFQYFKSFLLLIGLFLIIKTAKNYCNNYSFFVLFYLLYYAIMDAEQLRNFLAFSIVIYAMNFLFQEKKNNIKFIICILIASTIHTSSWIYLSLLLVNKFEFLRKNLKTVIFLYCICFIIMLNSSGLRSLLTVFGDFSTARNSDKVQLYLNKDVGFGFLYPTFVFFYFTFLVYKFAPNDLSSNLVFVQKELRQTLRIVSFDAEKNLAIFYNTVKIINVIALFFLPLCSISVAFYRLVRNITMLDLIYFNSIYNNYGIRNRKQQIKLFISVLFGIILWQIWDFVLYQDWNVMRLYFFHI